MDRLVELYRAYLGIKWAMLTEFWWLWLALLVCASAGLIILSRKR